MSILVTGAAGFIGFHVAKALLARGDRVIGIDNLNQYYDVRLKEARLAELRRFHGFSFAQLDVADRDRVFALVERHDDLRSIIHLAAQAGQREAVITLLELGADPLILDELHNGDALGWARVGGHGELASVLPLESR